jgi:hypothetical protein
MSLTAGAAMAQPYAPVPPPQIEAGPPPPAPGAAYVLEPGHWHWNGVRYVWIHRHWVIRQAGWGAHYVPGHWYQGPGGGWHWMPAHWG